VVPPPHHAPSTTVAQGTSPRGAGHPRPHGPHAPPAAAVVGAAMPVPTTMKTRRTCLTAVVPIIHCNCLYNSPVSRLVARRVRAGAFPGRCALRCGGWWHVVRWGRRRRVEEGDGVRWPVAWGSAAPPYSLSQSTNNWIGRGVASLADDE
jgi:hypothetical protein